MAATNVRFYPESGPVQRTSSCPLSAISDQILRRSEIPLSANSVRFAATPERLKSANCRSRAKNGGRTELSTFASLSFAPEAKVGVEPYKQ